MTDRWSSGDAYEQYMGRWSRPLAREFLAWLGRDAGVHWLDVGCGTGALTTAICDVAQPASVTACDPSPAFIEHARTHLDDEGVEFVVSGVDALPERSGGFDRVVSGLVLNFVPDHRAAIDAMCRRATTGGVVSTYVWDYAEGMQFLRAFWDEATLVDRAARQFDEGEKFGICRPDALQAAFREAGLRDVTAGAIQVPTRFESFDDYWRPFLGGTGPAPSFVSSLTDDQRAALRIRLEDRLATNGPIELTARAWSVRGSV